MRLLPLLCGAIIAGSAAAGDSPQRPLPVFDIVPGRSVGPILLGASRAAVDARLAQLKLEADTLEKSGWRIVFDAKDQVVAIEIWGGFSHARLALGGSVLESLRDDVVRAHLRKAIPALPADADWTAPPASGLAIFHFESADTEVFSFRVFSPGHRFDSPEPRLDAGTRR